MQPLTNNWVEAVLESTEHLHRATLNPDIADRIVANATAIRPQKRVVALSLSTQQWLAAASVITLIGLNVFSALQSPTMQHLAQKENTITETYFSYW